jgi:hypothetical protein
LGSYLPKNRTLLHNAADFGDFLHKRHFHGQPLVWPRPADEDSLARLERLGRKSTDLMEVSNKIEVWPECQYGSVQNHGGWFLVRG